jgi:hypothetical protein
MGVLAQGEAGKEEMWVKEFRRRVKKMLGVEKTSNLNINSSQV